MTFIVYYSATPHMNNSRRKPLIHHKPLSKSEAHHGTKSLDVWKEEQGRRRKVVRQVCERLGLTRRKVLSQLMQSPKQSFLHFLVDDARGAIYCYIPKVACTNWKKVWMVLTGLTGERNLTAIPLMVPHQNTSKMELTKNTKSVTVISQVKDLKWKLRSYKKLVIVRHPFHRLLSAYRDKLHFAEGRPYFQKKVHSYIVRRRTGANLTDIQWPEFVDFLTLGRGQLADDHWSSYMSLCHPCAIDYDVIAKLETLQEDSDKFLRLIEAPEYLHFPNTSRTSRRTDSVLWSDYQRQLSSHQLSALYKAYGRDFELFGYN
ncbi:carbohydrate sulfotransferase 11-like [Macrobrachium nipponense]|uniref:carbohydrate sulfotransferase 11-like n=1 Tax=Macrobrachium nipponense TaxID=159736 RepID=UPI0030C8CE65